MTLNVKISTQPGSKYNAIVKTYDHADREKLCRAPAQVIEPGEEITIAIHSTRSFEVLEMTPEQVAQYEQGKADAAAKAESDAEIAKAEAEGITNAPAE